MSLLNTLAKVAIGVAMAKGAGHLANRGRSGGGSGNIGDMLGSVLGGGQTTSASSGSGGLGGLLDGLSQASRPSGGSARSGGGMDDLLGGLASQMGARKGSTGGGLGDLMGALTGGMASGGGSGGFGDLLNQVMAGGGRASVQATADQEAAAGLMIEAMIMAAKSDGKIDADEEARLMEHLGDISAEERAFVQEALRQPVDPGGLAAEVPNGLQPQIYAMSVMGIDLDNQSEAQYLHRLAQAMDLEPGQVNDIHSQMGAPALYS